MKQPAPCLPTHRPFVSALTRHATCSSQPCASSPRMGYELSFSLIITTFFMALYRVIYLVAQKPSLSSHVGREKVIADLSLPNHTRLQSGPNGGSKIARLGKYNTLHVSMRLC